MAGSSGRFAGGAVDTPPLRPCDVIVAGAGAVGLTLALSLARQGLSVLIAGRLDTRATGRTVALLSGSVRLLADLGVWQGLAPDAAPLRVMRIVDDTGSLFRVPPVRFEAREIGAEAFGFNIENARLIAGLAEVARATAGIALVETLLEDIVFSPERATATLVGGGTVEAPLLAAADGRTSPARRAGLIPAREWAYPQTALTAVLRHDRPHDDISTEFHTRAGPFTLVPLPARPGAPHRSSLVWVMAPEDSRRRRGLERAALHREIEVRSRHLLGRIEVEGTPGSFPISGLSAATMTAPRLALLGEAAHAFPPIGAQGLNLGLRDVEALARVLGGARLRGEDIGGAAVLDRYARARRRDVALRTFAVDGLNRALLADLLPVDLLRGAGLAALGSIGPLRRFLMRAGMDPRASSGGVGS